VAVYTCGICEIVLMQNVPPGTKVPCPACGKGMIAKSGPDAPDIQFPQTMARDSVLDLEVPEAVRKALEKKGKRQTRVTKRRPK
jgi:hypothetical protein